MKPLLPRPAHTDPTTLEDLMLCLAATIEDSLLETGANPGVDYTILDLYKLAQPFALECWKDRKSDISYTTSWP